MLNKRFGKLTVVKDSGERDYKQNILWECQCDCGNKVLANTDILNKGEKISCGCLKQSKGEYFIERILKENNIKYEKEKSLIKNYPLLRFDFYINKQYIIEFDGKQHFLCSNNGWNNKEHFEKTRKNDIIKNKWCKDNNIPLIRIPYTHLEEVCIEDLLLETSKFIYKGEEYYERIN
jgi:YHS domain-containing protein